MGKLGRIDSASPQIPESLNPKPGLHLIHLIQHLKEGDVNIFGIKAIFCNLLPVVCQPGILVETKLIPSSTAQHNLVYLAHLHRIKIEIDVNIVDCCCFFYYFFWYSAKACEPCLPSPQSPVDWKVPLPTKLCEKSNIEHEPWMISTDKECLSPEIYLVWPGCAPRRT